MTPSDISLRLQELMTDYTPESYEEFGSLSKHARTTIFQCTTNYSVTNLITFCREMNVRIDVRDLATEDRFKILDIADIRNCITELMYRYDVTTANIYRATGVHYTESNSDSKGISIKILLSVLSVIHADLIFYQE